VSPHNKSGGDDPTEPTPPFDKSINEGSDMNLDSVSPTAPVDINNTGSIPDLGFASLPKDQSDGLEIVQMDSRPKTVEDLPLRDAPVDSSALKTILLTELPQSTQSLLANVEMQISNTSSSSITPSSKRRSMLGSFILLGPLGRDEGEPPELENVLELRSLAAPRRAVLRRAIHTDRGEQYRSHFAQEGELARQIVHANLVRTYQVGQYEGISYRIREFVVGISLSDFCSSDKNEQLTYIETMALMQQVSGVLTYLHQLTDAKGQNLNLVHGSISPSEILIGQTGKARLTEPALCQKAGLEIKPSQMTRSAKSAYAAPEQLADNRTTAASDWYSLGVVLSELLIGEPLKPLPPPELGLDMNALSIELDRRSSITAELNNICRGLLADNESMRLIYAQKLKDYCDTSLAKMSRQPADDILSALVRSTRAPVFLANEIQPTDETIQPNFKPEEPLRVDKRPLSENTPLIASPRGPTAINHGIIKANRQQSAAQVPWLLMLFLVFVGVVFGIVIMSVIAG